MKCLCGFRNCRCWLLGVVTVVMALASGVLSSVYASVEASDIGTDVANTLFMLCLAVFIAAIGMGLVTGNRGDDAAVERDDESQRPGKR